MSEIKNVIVSGANRGIGKAILQKYASCGCNIWACMRKENTEILQEYEMLEKKYNIWIHPVYFDLNSEEEIKRGIKQILDEKQDIDILVNNAAINHYGLFAMSSLKEIKNIYNVNVFGTMYVTQLILRKMIRQRKGVVINIASIAGMDSHAGDSVYGSSKAAIISFTKCLASEVADYGIRVNGVAPGPVRTDMIEKNMKKVDDQIFKNSAMKRLATPNEVAEVVYFLGTEEAGFVNGQVVRIDGGNV